MNGKKKIVFLSGTRAEYGKLKPLIKAIQKTSDYEPHLFITGMHMLEKYGSTAYEILKNFSNVYLYNNQAFGERMDIALSNTIYGFSHYVNECKPDLIIVHGDRVEALAGAIVGSFNNILVAHVEGGELSGTIDELIRHSVTKLSHLHFVANEEAKKRLIQMGEKENDIYVTGSPDIDIMFSDSLPTFKEVLEDYDVKFNEFAILLYHPVTTEIGKIPEMVKELIDAVIESAFYYIVIYPNNDPGSEIILKEYERLKDDEHFKVFPSVRFERFLTLLKNCKFIIGNSSAGIREAPIYSIPTINIGNRQHNRFCHESIFNIQGGKEFILESVQNVLLNNFQFSPSYHFGNGKSVEKFIDVLQHKDIWKIRNQKQFVDI